MVRHRLIMHHGMLTTTEHSRDISRDCISRHHSYEPVGNIRRTAASATT